MINAMKEKICMLRKRVMAECALFTLGGWECPCCEKVTIKLKGLAM